VVFVLVALWFRKNEGLHLNCFGFGKTMVDGQCIIASADANKCQKLNKNANGIYNWTQLSNRQWACVVYPAV